MSVVVVQGSDFSLEQPTSTMGATPSTQDPSSSSSYYYLHRPWRGFPLLLLGLMYIYILLVLLLPRRLTSSDAWLVFLHLFLSSFPCYFLASSSISVPFIHPAAFFQFFVCLFMLLFFFTFLFLFFAYMLT